MGDIQLFSAESMTEGQPDKLCDLISDSILDEVLAKDRFARVSIDAQAAPGLVLVSGQLTTKEYADLTGIVRRTVADVGYSERLSRFDADSIAVLTVVEEQSPDVALVVDRKGAGNQGIVVGYATNEADRVGIDAGCMPLPTWLAHRLSQRLTEVRKTDLKEMLKPDGHAQVTMIYEDGIPSRLMNVTVSNQHQRSADLEQVREAIIESVIRPTLDQYGGLVNEKTMLRVNPGGPFHVGGPLADIGLTGRKSVCDTYGTAAVHGGSTLAGKDPTKTDRSATYMARYIAKNIVAAGLADRVEIRIAYLFGVEEPLSLQVQTFGTGKTSDKELAEVVRKVFDVTTPGIIETLNLRKVRYAPTACYGCFGRFDLDLPWEVCDQVDALKASV